MTDAEKLIAVALAEVGYREKATNASLDDPQANHGSGNWTKYARDLAGAGYYNGNKNGFEWCDVFADWCFYKAFGPDAQRIQCQTGPLGAAVPFSAGYYQAHGRYDRTPRVGDQAFFQENGALVHTGIVIEVTADAVVTVEGNAGDRVARRVHPLTDSYVAGFGHPLFDGEKGGQEAGSSGAERVGPVQWVRVALLQRGSAGPQVKAVQRLLAGAGIADGEGKVLEIDGQFGARTAAAVIAAQKKLFPAEPVQWDGQVGERTWTGLLTGMG